MTTACVVILSTSHRCCDLTQKASVSMRKCADWVNLKFVYITKYPNSIHHPEMLCGMKSISNLVLHYQLTYCIINKVSLSFSAGKSIQDPHHMLIMSFTD